MFAEIAAGAGQLRGWHRGPAHTIAVAVRAEARMRPVVVPHVERAVHVVEVLPEDAFARRQIWPQHREEGGGEYDRRDHAPNGITGRASSALFARRETTDERAQI